MVLWYGMTNIQHEIQEGGREEAVAVSMTTILFFVISLACIWLHSSILWLCSPNLHSDSERYLEEGFPWSSLV